MVCLAVAFANIHYYDYHCDIGKDNSKIHT
ncbi:hypothetical protein SAMN05421740_109199 [Parapedobacter koreensis]|uniref:Uncharacterized protein n=1 Tax=Parapedobacter koreensis TaxID=332977 RepID=A0A1H7SX03_9SPHI|nr:hypothetical protein SAMN05421740_109199 [Parapedobacter koreensis]